MLVNEKTYLTTLSLPTISPPCPSLYPLSTLSPPLPHPSGSAEKDPKNQALASALTTFMKQAGVRVTSALMERTPSFMNKDKRGLPKFPRSTRKVRASNLAIQHFYCLVMTSAVTSWQCILISLWYLVIWHKIFQQRNREGPKFVNDTSRLIRLFIWIGHGFPL